MNHLEQVKVAAFYDELEKLAINEVYAKRLADPSWRADPENPDRMTKAKWIQTAIDLPIVIGSQALGYGIAKTMAEVLRKKTIQDMQQGKPPPGWLKHLPMGMGMVSSLGAYALGRAHDTMRARREEAERTGKVVIK